MRDVSNGSVLPKWAAIKGTTIEVNPAAAYSEAFKALGVKIIDQYWLEVARRCFTNRIKDLVRGDADLRDALVSKCLDIRICRDPAFVLADYPFGAGPDMGSLGFRKHYRTYISAVGG